MKVLDVVSSNLTLTIRTTKDHAHIETTRDAIYFITSLAQLFGLMPLNRTKEKDVNSVGYSRKSWQFVFSLYNLLGATVSMVFCIVRFNATGILLDKTATMAFYIASTIIIFQFMRVASSWRFIMREWYYTETSISQHSYKLNLKKRFILMTSVFLSLALLEHSLFILNAVNSTYKCKSDNETSVQVYYEFAFAHVFCTTKFAIWKAILTQIANILTTFCWNFTDLFIMLLSSSLALRFSQLNKKLENNKQNIHVLFWKCVREDFNKLCTLCKLIDTHIGPLITVSFINNIYFICIQLYNSLKPRYGFLEALYFFYSFGFVLSRTVAVSLYAGWVNDESRKPLHILFSIPTEHYNTEINRFIEQIFVRPIGLTGCDFFLVTRSFLLRVAGTIVTFELMLFQFAPVMEEVTHAHKNGNICIECKNA